MTKKSTEKFNNISPSGFKREDTLVILFGQTGAGKSSFINYAFGEQVAKVGHNIASETQQVSLYMTFHPKHRNRRFFFVDTPGFDDYKLEDRGVLDRIVKWLKTCPGGLTMHVVIIYLIEIDQTRQQEVLGMCPSKLLPVRGVGESLVITSTKWSNLPPGNGEKIGNKREVDLSRMFAAKVHRFRDSPDSAWQIVGHNAPPPLVKLSDLASRLDSTLPKVKRKSFLSGIFSKLF